MTRQSPYVIDLSEADRAVLKRRVRAYTASHAEVVRAKIVLLAAVGESNVRIAERVDVHVQQAVLHQAVASNPRCSVRSVTGPRSPPVTQFIAAASPPIRGDRVLPKIA